MTRPFSDQALRLAARLKAYDWFCKHHDLSEPDFESSPVDEVAVLQQGLAWAWARENWGAFLPLAGDEEAHFLMDLFSQGKDTPRQDTVHSACRDVSGESDKGPKAGCKAKRKGVCDHADG